MEKLIEQAIGIKALDLLFYNYDDDMLNEMLEIKNFQHIWDNYIGDSDTHIHLWRAYNEKMSVKMRVKMLEIANRHFGKEATEFIKGNL